ncbi:MAG: hypothetical protein ABIN89_27295 [Chitinophagaceae bacterium]
METIKSIKVDLKASNGKYVCAENSGSSSLSKQRCYRHLGNVRNDYGGRRKCSPQSGEWQVTMQRTEWCPAAYCQPGNGWSAPALALHGANLAAASGAQRYNFIGHSRGAVESIMAAWFLYAYGSGSVRNMPFSIFAIDPVPGTGEWYGILTQLPPNVVNYVGVYAWDQSVQPGDRPYTALVPRPNGLMTNKPNNLKAAGNERWNLIRTDGTFRHPGYAQPSSEVVVVN